MVHFLVAAFVATLVVAVAAIVGVPAFAQEAANPVRGETMRARLAIDTGHDLYLAVDDREAGHAKRAAKRAARGR